MTFKRIALALLLLTAATLMIPALRHRAQPRIDSSREWLGQKLEGPFSPVLTPYRTLKTESRMSEAARLLIRDRNRGMPAPLPDAFAGYLAGHEIESNDGWGAPIILRQEPDSVAMRSAGRDLEYDTEDDIVAKVRYRAPANRVFRRR